MPFGGILTSGLGSIVGGIFGGGSASKAAEAQAEAARYAANLTRQSQAEALAMQQGMYETQQQQQAPWLAGGTGGLTSLLSEFGLGTLTPTTTMVPEIDPYASERAKLQSTIDRIEASKYTAGGTRIPISPAEAIKKYQATQRMKELPAIPTGQREQTSYALTPSTESPYFRDFTMADYEADPGYQFRREEGMRGIEGLAAARQGALSGKAVKDVMRFNQDLASQEYGNAFNRFQINQSNRFNRLASLAGMGQTATNQLGQAASNYGNAASNITMQGGSQLADLATQAGNARASGYASQGNIYGNMFSNLGSLPLLYNQFNQ